ncbi:MAG: hypothetical protein ACO3RG_03915 [Nitriliruptoraceae bacterium]
MTPDADLRDLLDLGDLDGLVREVDRRCARGDWDAVLVLRDACLAATERTGRQLWGPARYAAYRIALEGPAPLAAAMPEAGVARHGLGPLTEVVAQAHTFAELADGLDSAVRPVVAQERVLRGEDLRGDPRAAQPDADAPPLVLQPFEPAYALPTYRAAERLDGAHVLPPGAPAVPPEVVAADPSGGSAADVPVPPRARALAAALRDAVATWESASEARVAGAALGGATALDAARAAAPGLTGARRIGVPDLLALVAAAGAAGGVHGPRRGGAARRGGPGWVARVATGLDEPGAPVDVDELEFRLEDLELVAFRTPGPEGWRLEVALADPATGVAAAVSAVDVPVRHPVGEHAPGGAADGPGAPA